MSILTKVLKLFCYDPETDGNLTFNVTEALTKNWEKIDAALAPLGGATTAQAALAALGAGVRDNLLINPSFIDQRDAGTYSGSVYGPDCLMGTANVTKSLNDDGSLTISSNAENSNTVKLLSDLCGEPYSNLVGRTFTFSFLATDGILRSLTATVPEIQPSNGSIAGKIDNGVGIGILYDSTRGLKGQIYTPNTSVTVVRNGAKLEEGTGQTLASQENGIWKLLKNDYDETAQLLKCQKYLLPLGDVCALGLGAFNNRIWFSVPTPTRMRTTPVLQGDLTLYPPSDAINITNWTVEKLNAANCVTIYADGTGIEINAAYSFKGNGAFLTAEL